MQAGDRLQHYEIQDYLGKGGFGEAWRAFDTHLEIDVAIKVLLPKHIHNEDMVRRFVLGARAAAKLQHPHIIRMLYLGEIPEKDLFFSVMEYLPYGTLMDRIQEGSLSQPELLATFVKIAKATHFAHENGFVHRDMKPDNVLYNAEGEPVVSDFDLSRVMGEARFTKKGTILGTPYFISPEQADGLDVTPHADVYSLGVMLFFMLTQTVPFDAPELTTILTKHLSEPVPRASARNPNLSPTLDRIIEKAMAKKKEKRYASALELAEAVNTLLPPPSSEPPTEKTRQKPAPALPPRLTEMRDELDGATQHMVVGAQLTVLVGALAGQILPLRENVVRVGARGAVDGNDIGLEDGYVSTWHGRFENHPDGWYYIDQSSRNGTHLIFPTGAKKRLTAEDPYRLKYGDVLELGDTHLRFDAIYQS